MKLQRVGLVVAILVVTVTAGARAQKPAASGGGVAKAVAAANAFLATLDDAQRAKARLDLSEKTRTNWSNLPTGSTLQSGATDRNGIKLGDLTPGQQEAALALVAVPLSASGFKKVMNIVTADQVLEDRANRPAGSRIRFGRAEYYVAILGTPSTSSPWMIQFGGHHLAINVTVTGGTNVLTPSHTGTQPATYTLNGQTIRPLGNENDKAFALVTALDEAQRKQALLGYDVKTTVLGPGLDGKVIQPEAAGSPASTPIRSQAARPGRRVGWHPERRDCRGETRGRESESRRDVVCLERSHHERQQRVLQNPGADGVD